MSMFQQNKAFENWQKDKKKREESKAPVRPLQFEDPRYIGKSESKKTYNWETETLKPLSIKEYGRSYNDKFDSWAKSQGIEDYEMASFRSWLDSKEDGAKIKGTDMDSILKNSAAKQKAELPKFKEDFEKRSREVIKKKDVKAQKAQPEKEFLDNLTGFLKGEKVAEGFNVRDKKKGDNESTLNKVGKVEQGDNPSEGDRFIARSADSALLGLNSQLAKKRGDALSMESYYNQREFGKGGGKDLLSTGLGYLLPGVGAYKGLNATKGGKALTELGAKGMKQRLASEGAKGAIIGAGMSGAEVGIREGLNPEEQDWKDNAAYVGLGTTAGAIADPALYGAGKAIGKGFEKAAGKAMKNIVPSDEQTAKTLAAELEGTPKLKPTEYTLPNGEKVKIKNHAENILSNTKAKAEAVKPEVEAYDKEFEEAVQQQYEYLKNSMGKGVDGGTTSNGLAGNSREVTGKYTISNNPKWYQDFYAQNGRKPNNQELRELAEVHVREGFADEGGELPSWKPSKVQEIDDQIDELTVILREQPEQEAALKPILEALEEDRAVAMQSIDNARTEYGELSQRAEAIEGALKNPRQEVATSAAEIQPIRVDRELPDGVQAMQVDTIPLRNPSGSKQFKEMGFLESAVNKVVKSVGGKGYEKPISRQELLNSFRKNIGVTIRSGRLGSVSENVQGYFKVNPEVIRSRQYGDIGVISHEIGHHLDKQFSLTNEAFDNELIRLGQATSAADYTPQQIREEGLAEYIRLFLTDPEKAIAAAPNFSQHFDKALPKKVKNGLLQSQADVDRWIEQGPELRLRGKVDRTGREVETIGEKVDKVYSQFIDKFDRIKKVEKEITGKLNSAEKSIYKKARLSAGAPKKAEMVLQDLKDILKPIEKYGYNMKDVGDYVTAVHALELENMGQKVANEAIEEASLLSESLREIAEPDEVVKAVEAFQKKYDIELSDEQIAAISNGQEFDLNEDQLYLIAQANRIESGMTLDEINKTMAKYDSPEMKGVQEQIVGYNNKLLDELVDGQVLSKEAVEAMKEKYPNYVPFYRFFEDDITVGMAGNKGFTNLTNPVKRLQGSTRDVIDPLESIVKNTFAVVNAVEKNKVGLELSRLANIEGAGRFIERLEGAGDVKKEHIVTVFEKGEKVQYQLDKELYESIQQLDEDRANKVIQFLSYPTSILRAGATLTPEFMLRNPIRDQFQAFVVSNYGYNPIIDLPLGVFEVIKGKAFKKEGLYKQWAMSGGGYGNYLSQDRNYLRETMKTLKKEGKLYQRGYRTITNPKELGSLIMRTLQSMSEFSEEATKLGEFRKAVKKGATTEEAAFQARDLMDFGRVGSDMRQWNRAVAFLNANLQGKDRIARAFKHNPIRTTTRAISGVTLPAYAAYLAMETLANEKQREIYENTPKWMKDTFFLLPIPGTDEVARIPKPFDLAPVFANPVEQIMDYVKQNDPDEWNEFLKRQATEISKIPHMLTGLAPVIENITNYSFFTGGPIVPRRDQDLLPQDQYGVSTSLTARSIGNAIGTSPYKVDNLIRGYGAGLGKYATSGLDKVLQKAGVGQLPPQEAKKWSELPVVNAFTVDSTGGGQIMTDFYDNLDVLRKGNNSAKRNDSIYEREGDYKLLNKISRKISELRNESREIQGSYDISPTEKRKRLDQLDSEMNELAREALIQIGEKQK